MYLQNMKLIGRLDVLFLSGFSVAKDHSVLDLEYPPAILAGEVTNLGEDCKVRSRLKHKSAARALLWTKPGETIEKHSQDWF